MTKEQIKSILISLRTKENEKIVNNILGRIDIMENEEFANIIQKVGNNYKDIETLLKKKIQEKQGNLKNDKTPINDIFTYGISDDCIHLHVPVDLRSMLIKNGILRTVDIINLYLLDAIDKINKLRNDGFYKFQDKNKIYMISPILVEREMQFLQSIGFQTKLYSKRELKDNKFVENSKEAKLAVSTFGTDKNVGTASINFETINSKYYKNRRKEKINELAEKGVTFEEDSKAKI